MKFAKWFLVIFAAFAVVACGSESSDGGGGNGTSTSATTVDGSNKTEVARTARVGSEKAIEGSAAPKTLASSMSGGDLSFALMKDTVSYFDQGAMSRDIVDLSASVCPDGGSAVYETTGEQNSQYGFFTVVYDNCSYSYGSETTLIDGTATWTFNEDNSFSYEYDLTTTYAGETTTITGTYSCNAEGSCSYEDNFVEGGTSYSVSNVLVSGNNSSGFSVSARVSHEDYGYIDIQGTGLVLCSGGGFSAGNISVTDSSGSVVLQINFVSCTEMTVTYEGVAETVSQ